MKLAREVIVPSDRTPDNDGAPLVVMLLVVTAALASVLWFAVMRRVPDEQPRKATAASFVGYNLAPLTVQGNTTLGDVTTDKVLTIDAPAGDTLTIYSDAIDHVSVTTDYKSSTPFDDAPTIRTVDVVITLQLDGEKPLVDLERQAIRAALDACGNNVTSAAACLGIHRQVLQRKMRRLGLRASQSRSAQQ